MSQRRENFPSTITAGLFPTLILKRQRATYFLIELFFVFTMTDPMIREFLPPLAKESQRNAK